MKKVLMEMVISSALALVTGATAQDALQIVSRHQGVWTKPFERTPSKFSSDGPLLGNGDMKVAIGGAGAQQDFYLCKNDLWRLKSQYQQSSPVPLGLLALSFPELKNAVRKIAQDYSTAETVTVLTSSNVTIKTETFVAAQQNLLVIRMVAEGKPVLSMISLQVKHGRGSTGGTGEKGGIFWGYREFLEDVDIPSGAAVAWRIIGAEIESGEIPYPSSDSASNLLSEAAKPVGGRFTLEPDKPVYLVAAMDSVFKSKDYKENVRKTIAHISGNDFEGIRASHRSWWAEYWNRSYVAIGNPVIEQAYYCSLYGMGSASRDPQFPPGIFGWDTTDGPAWSGDYHLNYNHQAPFYALSAANRFQQSDPHDAPLIDFIEHGRWYAKEALNVRGVYYPVGIGPLSIETTRDGRYGDAKNTEAGGLFYQQKSNAAYGLINIAQRWRCTYDPVYARKVYPYVREVVLFWTDYLKFEKPTEPKGTAGRYVIPADAIHEGSGSDVNPILSLGLVRNAMDLAVDMSVELECDAESREKWKHIIKHLSTWSTQEMNGKTVFRYSEQGTAWWRDNTLGIQHIYPGNAIGLDCDPKWIKVARNTIEVMQRWLDNNGSNSFFPVAVRVGYDPKTILAQLERYCRNTYPNGFQRGNPHGIENLSTVPNTINEMLCMSHVPAGTALGTQLLRLFPVWPKDKDARFVNIRAWGAFLVSSELKGGEVQYVTILSERGRKCVVLNPWPASKVSVSRNKKRAETVSGERITLETKPGEMIELARGE